MKNNFESSIKNKVEQFDEVPAEKIWTGISEKINTNSSSPKNNTWKIWATIAVGAIILSAIFWKINSTQNEELQNAIQQPIADGNTEKQATAQAVLSEGQGMSAKEMFPLELEAARKSDKALMVYVCMEGCKPCARFVNETLSQPDVNDYLEEHFDQVAVDMKNKENAPFLKNYKTNASPSVLFFAPDGTFIDKSAGAIPKADFMEIAKGACGKISEINDLSD